MDIEVVQVDGVIVHSRHRPLDAAKVKTIAESMAVVGLNHPITVHIEGDDVHLVAGLHRLEAAKSLGWTSISAVVQEASDIDRELWELDENLARADLTPEQINAHTRRRLELVKLKAKAEKEAAELGGTPCPTQLARISHNEGCIGPRNLRKCFCNKALSDSGTRSDANRLYL